MIILKITPKSVCMEIPSIPQMIEETEFIVSATTMEARGPWVDILDEIARDCGVPSAVHLANLAKIICLFADAKTKSESPAHNMNMN